VDSPLLVATVDYAGGDGNDVVLLLLRSGVSFTATAQTRNQGAVAGALTALEPGATGDLATIFDALVDLPADALPGALDQLSGDLLATVDGFDPMPAFVTAVLGAAAPGPWVAGLGGISRVGGDGNAAGYQAGLGGAAAGFNLQLSPAWSGGAAIGYGHSDVVSSRGVAAMESVWAGLRGAWQPGALHVQGVLGYGHDDVQTDRRIRFGSVDRTARASFAYHRAHATADVGYLVPAGAVRAEPFARVATTQWWRDRYRERGADSVALVVDADRGTTAASTLGVRGQWTGEGWSIEPTLAWKRLLTGRRFTTQARFAGTDEPFEVTGVTLPRDSVAAGLHATLGWVRLSYDVIAAPGATIQSASLGVEFRW
jgi:uncharacterized protein with beta-barrel porin domain